MQRFVSKREILYLWRLILPLVFTVIILVCFSAAVGSVSQSSTTEHRINLEQAVRRNVIQCYITEGFYPESLDYLVANYPIHYDKDAFFIDYQPIGENIMPEITIIFRQ